MGKGGKRREVGGRASLPLPNSRTAKRTERNQINTSKCEGEGTPETQRRRPEEIER